MKLFSSFLLYIVSAACAIAGTSESTFKVGEDNEDKAAWHGTMRLKPCIMVETPFSNKVVAKIDNYRTDTRDMDRIAIDIPANFTGRICATETFTKDFNGDGHMEMHYGFAVSAGTHEPITPLVKTTVKFNGNGANNRYWITDNARDKLVRLGSLTTDTGDGVPDEETVEVNLYPSTRIAKVMQLCGAEGDSACIPFGSSNSGNWIASESAPSATFEDKPITIEKSQTVGFSIGADAGYQFGKDNGSSLGLNISFGISSTDSISQDLYTSYMTKTELRNDLGNINSFKLSSDAITAALKTARYDGTGRVVNGEEAFGRNSWKNMPFNTRDTWTDELTDSNCSSGKTHDILFLSKVGFNTSNSSLGQMQGGYSDISSVRVKMDCFKDIYGHLFRTKKVGLLN